MEHGSSDSGLATVTVASVHRQIGPCDWRVTGQVSCARPRHLARSTASTPPIGHDSCTMGKTARPAEALHCRIMRAKPVPELLAAHGQGYGFECERPERTLANCDTDFRMCHPRVMSQHTRPTRKKQIVLAVIRFRQRAAPNVIIRQLKFRRQRNRAQQILEIKIVSLRRCQTACRQHRVCNELSSVQFHRDLWFQIRPAIAPEDFDF